MLGFLMTPPEIADAFSRAFEATDKAVLVSNSIKEIATFEVECTGVPPGKNTQHGIGVSVRSDLSDLEPMLNAVRLAFERAAKR